MAPSRDQTTPAEPGPRRAANLRLALVLGSIALAFFVGYVVKIAVFGPK